VQCENTRTSGLQQQNSFVIYEYERQESIKKRERMSVENISYSSKYKMTPFKISNFQENTYKKMFKNVCHNKETPDFAEHK